MSGRSSHWRWILPAIGGLIVVIVLGAIGVVDLNKKDAEPSGEILGGELSCEADDEVRSCGSGGETVPSFDGTEIEATVLTPDGDGPWPLLLAQGGFPGGRFPQDQLVNWPKHGWATISISNRGLGESGGTSRFMDTRYEVRDAQELIGRLVDEGIADPERIGALGGSYGGGQALALGALRDRVMLPDGGYAPWTSPEGTPVSLAVAVSQVGWTDLADAFVPNGSNRTYDASPEPDRGQPGPLKLSSVESIHRAGAESADLGQPGPLSSLATWFARLATPPGAQVPGAAALPSPEEIAVEMRSFHSASGIEDSVAPAPTLMINGLSDDLFPADQAVAYANQVRARHPDAPVGVLITDVGHARAQSKDADRELALATELEWLDHYLGGEGEAPSSGVELSIQTCEGDSGDPVEAEDWATIAPGEATASAKAPQLVTPTAADPASSQAFDPFGGGGACATAPATDPPGTAFVNMPVDAEGFTLAGAPILTARFEVQPGSQIAARLIDVDPEGNGRLVSRAIWMPSPGLASETFELAPTAWRFEPGHVAKLQLLPADPRYGAVLATQAPVRISDLELRLPVLEEPGAGA
jgi:hypothetical protein